VRQFSFPKTFPEKNTVGIIPKHNYHPGDNQSSLALKWLKWISVTNNIDVLHKLNGGEAKIGKYKVDGLSGRTVYEFHGCYWHGCPSCMKNRNHLTADQFLTAKEAYEMTINKRKFLESKGYQVIEMWECVFKRMIKNDYDLEKFVKNTDIIEPLNP